MQITHTLTGNSRTLSLFFAICSNRVSDHNHMSLLFPFFSLSSDFFFLSPDIFTIIIKPILKRIRKMENNNNQSTTNCSSCRAPLTVDSHHRTR
ncbi:hypothetical protein BCV71DRAFT_86307 [Rhizopus microsporus]|uniref:Uncharacterized protein n=1 Tax=Rhizopus microsporus TaxID=58291 RepID=A0A1X0RKW8_RHIZD|nr:hypothetical protein BCV71DRAFT_86307 [Rhizopus microsporus]